MSWTPAITALAISIIVGLIVTPLLIRLGHRYHLLDTPGKHKRHKRPTPFLGGVALFASVWITVLISWLIFPNAFAELADRLFYVLIGALVILLVGLSDDLSPLPAWVKLVAQIGAGLILYMGGLRVELLSTPFGSVDIGSFSVVITVLWVVILSNAINLIDGLDGLAGGVSLIGAVALAVIGQFYQIGAVLVVVYAMIGFLAVFLYFNRYPARIFLGDSGSMQLGFYFAVFSLAFPLKSYTLSALYAPLLALGVPVLETVSSLLRRLVAGKSIMKADRRHLFHYLSLAGLSPRQVVSVFYLLALVFGCFSLAMFFWNRLIVLGGLVIFMVVVLSLFLIFMTNSFRRKKVVGSDKKNAKQREQN